MASDDHTTAAPAATLGPLNDRAVFDAIRGAYDLGYEDAHKSRSLFPRNIDEGNRGREVEQDHGGALIHTLARRFAAPAAQEAEPAADGDHVEEDADTLLRLLDSIEQIVSGETVTSSDRLYDRSIRPRKMTIRDAQAKLEPMVNVLRSIVVRMRNPAPRPQADAGAVPEGWRDVAQRCLQSMDEAVRWRETGIGRPPEQTCMDSIAELQRLLASAPQAPAEVVHLLSPTEQKWLLADPKAIAALMAAIDVDYSQGVSMLKPGEMPAWPPARWSELRELGRSIIAVDPECFDEQTLRDFGFPVPVPTAAPQAPAAATATALEKAFREGWAACRDAEYVGEDAEDEAWGASAANGLAIDIEQSAPAAAPNCPRCSGSGEDPEGYYDQSKGDAGHTHDGPCRTCGGSGEAPAAAVAPAEDADGKAFRAAARLGLTLRMYGGCAQSSIPGSPCAYEVVTGDDPAAAMREAVARAEAVIAAGGEAQRLHQSPEPAAAPTQEAEDGAFPMQPIHIAADGVVRFKCNRMVNALYEFAQPRGLGLNEMAKGDYTSEERMQFAQLIGYSVDGYGNLSYASEESVVRADHEAARARQEGGEA